MRPALDDTVRPRVHRKLRKLARATSRARDLEVQLTWLNGQPGADAPEGTIASEIRQAWQAAYDASAAEARAALDHDVAKTAKRLRGPLSHYRIDVRLDGRGVESTLASLAGDLMRRDAVRLEEKLAAVQGPSDGQAVHAARIAGKRLRYLLEPLVPSLAGARNVVRRLTKLQDGLGGLRDAQLVDASLETFVCGMPSRRDDAATLIEQARADVEAAYRRLEHDSLGAPAEALLSDVRSLASTLSNATSQRPEVERKFLLSALPAIARRSPSARIEQGYLPGHVIEERVRRTTNGNEKFLHRTVKIGDGLERTEIEEELGEEDFQRLWRLTRHRRVYKRRYYVPDGNLTWEIDRFHEPAIIVAEVELPTPATKLTIPSWIEAVLVREVTSEPEFANVHLAH